MEIHDRQHPRASRIANLTQVVRNHFIDVSKLHGAALESHYDTEQDATTVVFLLYQNSEVFGHASFTHKLGTTTIGFKLEKNGEVLASGDTAKDWLKYLKERYVLRPWVKVE